MNKISVLMCVYNTNVRYLKEAIDSILNQTCNYFEFIIVNDGSTDSEVNKILKDYQEKDKRIILIENEKNVGLTASLNIGLSLCSGKYIARMDSDDIALPIRLEKQYCFMETHPEIDVLGSKVEQFGDVSLKLPINNKFINNDKIFPIKMLFNNVGPVHPTVMIKSSFLKEHNISYRQNIRKAQDYALWLDLLNNNAHFYCLQEVLLKYRIHKGQITTGASSEQALYKRKIVEDNLIKQFFLDRTSAELLSGLFSEKYAGNYEDYKKAYYQMINKNKLYDEKALKNELGIRWIHKVFKCAIKGHDYRGFKYPYTYACLLSSCLGNWIREQK